MAEGGNSSKRNNNGMDPNVQPVVVRPEPEATLLTWKAPSRVFKTRNREFWVTIIAMGTIMGLILFFIDGWMPAAVIVAFIFFVYVLSTVPPEEVEHRITNKGVVFGGKTYRWGQLISFWFDEKLGQKMLVVEMIVIPGRMKMLLGKTTEEEVRRVLKTYMIEERPKDGWTDKAAKWVNKKVPLE